MDTSNTLSTSKPQTKFTKYIRNNLQDNSIEFFSQEHHESIKAKISQLDYKQSLFISKVNLPEPLSRDRYEFIEKEEDLKKAIENLEKEKEIAIDIEQTNLETYQGYICLIQISSPSYNYIFDAIILHDVIAPYMKKIFENPNILKIFYGGGSDLLWLNRDFGIFVVNYFDIYNACLFHDKREDCSLVGLLSRYCKVKIDRKYKKQFQMSDWRQRPLSTEMLNYAIMDSYYLIYLKNLMLENIQKSIQENRIQKFFEQQQQLCLKSWQIPKFNYRTNSHYFDKEIKVVYKELLQAQKEQKYLQSPKNTPVEMKQIFLNLCQLVDSIAAGTDNSFDDIVPQKKLIELCLLDDPEKASSQLIAMNKHLEAQKDKILEIFQYKNITEFDLEDKNQSDLTRRELQKEQRRQQIQNQLASKNRAIYEQCTILAPDGSKLSHAPRDKAQWYLKKEIATLVSSDPLVIKLKFEPSGRRPNAVAEFDIDKDEYLQESRKNQCVVCGQGDNLLKYHVIPSMYRQHFPLDMKAHRAYDVLLLCMRCLDKANKAIGIKINELTKKFSVPMVEINKAKQLVNSFDTLKKDTASYSRHQAMMPEDGKARLLNNIKENFKNVKGDDTITKEFKQKLESLPCDKSGDVEIGEEFIEMMKSIKNIKDIVKKESNKDFKNMHGKLIVDQLQTDEQLKDFTNDWRNHFMDSMDPQFLPHDWKLALKRRTQQVQEVEKQSSNEQLKKESSQEEQIKVGGDGKE